jgi:hypothetical protein
VLGVCGENGRRASPETADQYCGDFLRYGGMNCKELQKISWVQDCTRSYSPENHPLIRILIVSNTPKIIGILFI